MFSRAAKAMGDRAVTIQMQMQVKGLNGAREMLRAIPKRIALHRSVADQELRSSRNSGTRLCRKRRERSRSGIAL